MNMNIGFVWFNNDPKLDLHQKVRAAAADFRKKYNHAPDYCLVNVGDAQGENLEEMAKTCNMIVQSYKFVQHHNFWVGFEGMDVDDGAI